MDSRHSSLLLNQQQEIILQPLTTKHAADINTLNQLILSDRSIQRLYHPIEPSHIAATLTEKGFGIGAFHQEQLVAYRLIRYCDQWPNSLAVEFPQYPADTLAQFAGMAAHPMYRGRGITSRLCSMALTQLKQHGYRFAIATCHPQNQPSLALLQRHQFQIVGSVQRNGALRHLLQHDLNNTQQYSN